VPIDLEGHIWGVILVVLQTGSLFPEADLELVRLFGQQLSLALENKRRFDRQDALLERLRVTNEEVEAASRHKSQFLANMSHELRTPLNAIIGYSEILEEDLADHAGGTSVLDLRRISAAGRHLLGLINNILDISKIEAGKTDVHVTRFRVADVVDEAIAATGANIAASNNVLKVRCHEGVGAATSDAGKIRQILINLLGNAAKFTTGGEIAIDVLREVEGQRATLVFVVSDTGIGMGAAEKERVFDAFTQATAETAKRYGGTGLGLSLCQAFATLLGGEIRVASEAGVGSQFTVCIPDQTAPERRRSASMASLAGSSEPPLLERTEAIRQPLVIVIEDDADAAALMKRQLKEICCRVIVSPTGEAGIELVRRHRPAAVLLDVMLPGIDGWTVLRILQGDPATADVPIVMVTVTDDAKLGFNLGASDFLQKPVQADRLRGVVERYLLTDPPRPALVVDDDRDVRALIARHLEARGIPVVEARDGVEGLAKLAAERPGLVLLDLQMPRMDGFEFLHAKSLDPALAEIPVIVLSSRCVDEREREALRHGAVRVLRKAGQPIERVVDAVASQLRHRLVDRAAA
jgi:signal transduction histidine kinase/CheY-like chemotaxis protein